MTHIPSLFDNHITLKNFSGFDIDLLDFSKTRTGTHKFIKAEYVFRNFEVADFPIFCAISSGNYAYSLVVLANEIRKQYVYLCMSESDSNNYAYLEGDYSEVLPLEQLANMFSKDGSKALRIGLELGQRGFPILLNQRLVEAIKAFVVDKMNICILQGINIKNVTNISDIILSEEQGNFELRFSQSRKRKLKKNLVYDFGDTLKNYDFIICPIGSGELAYQIALQTKAKVYGIIPDNHPLATIEEVDFSFSSSPADKLDTPVVPLRRYITRQKNIEIISLTGEEIISAYQIATKFDIVSEPSASVIFSLLYEKRFEEIRKQFEGKKILLVNTGKGINPVKN